ncbi:MAG: hypothetical protein NTY80_02315 [candidate division SR1 bacterium]|nr:hypothetical protein [candidate division SR1 bacterium]
MATETKKTATEKLSEAQRDLEKRKMRHMQLLVITILAVPIGIELGMFAYRPDPIARKIEYVVMAFLLGLTIIPDIIRDLSMKKKEEELRKKIPLEEQMMSVIRKEYRDICLLTFDRLPRKHIETLNYLWSKEDKTPEQIMDARDEELDALRFKLQAYQLSPERTAVFNQLEMAEENAEVM